MRVPWPSQNPEDYRGPGSTSPRSVLLRRAAWACLALSLILSVVAMYYGFGASAESQPNTAAAKAADVMWTSAAVVFVLSMLGGLWSAFERKRGR